MIYIKFVVEIQYIQEGQCAITITPKEKDMEAKKRYRHEALNICTLGGLGHGKTTLTSAMIKVVSRIGSTPSKTADLESEQPIHHPISQGVGVSYRSVDYETSGRHYTQIDGLKYADNVKMLISGSPKIWGAIWVVNAVEGVTPDSEAQLRLASQVHIPTIITFLNKSEKVHDEELIEICEMEMREILTDCGYDEEASPIIVGDALKALKYKGHNLGSDHWKPIVDLILEMNHRMPQPINPLDLPLIMAIREVIDHPKGTSTVRGEIIQGRVAVGNSVDVVGKGDRIKTRCVGLKEGNIEVDSDPGWISPGHVISDPKSIRSRSAFEATVYVMTQEECGAHIPLVGNDKPHIHIWTIDVTGHIHLPADVAIVNPGEHASVSISLDVSMAMQIGTRFEIKKMGSRIGMGIVTGLLD